MRLVLHIGMGKTGTTVLQRTLAQSGDCLSGQAAAYLGMDFDSLDPALPDWAGRARLAKDDTLALRQAGRMAARALLQRNRDDGIETFVISNEVLSLQARQSEPFLGPIRAVMDLQVVAWARNPASWLPSAYSQWGIRGKRSVGPVQPYREAAPKLLAQHYEGLLDWFERMPGIVTLYPYRRDGDIVAEFAAATGIDLTPLETTRRGYERREAAEQILRARFAAHYSGRSPSVDFESAVLPSRSSPALPQMIADHLDYGETGAIVAAHAGIFDRVRERTGVELRDIPDSLPPSPEPGPLRERLLELLVESTAHQARRIMQLEERIAALEAPSSEAGS